jgi:alkyl sulfatase BDS1-like metallo-beta-lactamase superfamily hydrolase
MLRDPEKEIAAGNMKIQGDGRKLGELMGLLDNFTGGFDIVTPRRSQRGDEARKPSN